MDHSRTLRAKVFAKATRAGSYFRKNQDVQMAHKHDSKRELIAPGKDKRYVRRDAKGRFEEVVDVGRSLAQDRRQHSKNVVPPGQGDRGDQRRRDD